jgi:hypothetical protein
VGDTFNPLCALIESTNFRIAVAFVSLLTSAPVGVF